MKKDAQKRRRGPGVKAAKAKLEAKLEAKLGPPDPLATWPVVSPESEKLRHHQVGHSGNFCLRRLNSFNPASRATRLWACRRDWAYPGTGGAYSGAGGSRGGGTYPRAGGAYPGAGGWRGVSFVPRLSVCSRLPQPAASPEIPSLSEELLETQVGLSGQFCWQHPDFSFQVEHFQKVPQSSVPPKKRRRSSQASSSPSSSSRPVVSF